MSGLGSIGSIIGGVSKVAAPLLGGVLGSAGSAGRAKSALTGPGGAASSLILNNSNPFFNSTFDPRTQSFNLAASPEVQAILDRSRNFTLPRISPQVDFGEFTKEGTRLSSSVDEIVGDLGQIEETLKNKLSALGIDADELNNLTSEQLQEFLALVEPGFGRLTETVDEAFALADQRLNDRRRAASGDLRESLSRRRILGSSFAADAQSRQEAEFNRDAAELANNQAQARAQNFLAELDLSRSIVQQNFDNTFNTIQQKIGTSLSEFQARLGRVQTELGARFNESQFRLDAFNTANQNALAFGQNAQQAAIAEQDQQNQAFEQFQALGEAATSITSGIQTAFSGLNNTVQQLLAEAAQGRGAAFGGAIDAFGKIGGNIFGGGFGGQTTTPPTTANIPTVGTSFGF